MVFSSIVVFQVYLDAYPQAGKILDLSALKLKAFRPGACIYQGGRFHRMMDPFAARSLYCPVPSVRLVVWEIS